MKLHDQSFNISGTYNIQHFLTDYARSLLLPDGRVEFFLDVQEHEMHTIGAPTFQHGEYEINDKGYGDEWYFEASSGNTVCIAFRWEVPRLRGDHATTIEDALELIDFLQSKLSRNRM